MSALTAIRVIELADSIAGEYCGKLLSDFGAEVIKVEPPERGSATRAMAPVLAGGCEGSVLFAYLNTNKQSVVLDLASASGTARLHQLIETADAVIGPPATDWAARHPSVVFCTITPHGQGAPPEFDNARSINVFHASGWGYHTPSHADPAKPPLQGPGRFLADYEAGLEAALCVASSLFGRLHAGTGECIDISAHAVLVSRADCILGRFITGEVPADGTRDDYDQSGPAAFFACADGYVYLYMTSRAHWHGMKTLLGQSKWLDEFDDDWLEFSVTADKVATFRRGFAAWVAGLPREEVSERAQRLGVPLVPVNGAADLHRSPQYRHRGFFQRVRHPVLGEAAYPTVPYLFSASPARISTAAPSLGQHTRPVLDGIATGRPRLAVKAAQLRTPRDRRGGPLEGVRVVELTKVWAGPYAGKLLAMLGAEVIKIETADSPEEMRAYGGTDINHAPYFLSINPEILSVDLDIKSTEGMARLRDLIARSDIVINNLRPGAMERQGLGYHQLTQIKPDIISVSIKMWGNDGPLGHQTGYAPCFAALAGLASLVGYPGGPPLGTSMRYGDSTVGAAAAYAAVVALLHRELRGTGQFVDLSAVETLSSMSGDCLLEHAVTGKPLTPNGNYHHDMCPHGCYPCADGAWISVAVATDAEWGALCDVLDAPALSGDDRYATRDARHRYTDALDAVLGRLTRGHDAERLAARLRAAGVPAAKSATVPDVIGDQRLWDRELYRFVTDHREGQRPIVGPSWRMTRRPARITRGAPDLGEDTDYVLREILGAPAPAAGSRAAGGT
ncbi:CaiB/BaiF CoA transferase family protein [Mycobacterium avium]|uniref:CoA-transferase n=1 Tax=Mycobacterium avium subsp. hominissuis TaxID=439334 RepID=A0AAI8SL51_MYCAV|nr:CoA transferase [Mycobacterium avium]APT10543.1 CoA transferase [Mycobacterium avium subsp. hominissuis]KDP08709.1 CoA transferase [Mycobacterium avium subsp. hominissuis 100]MCA2239141.1 CoA transferase [Mycobacterium avium]MCA2259328.1 CoA transferase [Mycobacterium avium]MCA2271040.1 CoA transferase [Mycobacterium avium]